MTQNQLLLGIALCIIFPPAGFAYFMLMMTKTAASNKSTASPRQEKY